MIIKVNKNKDLGLPDCHSAFLSTAESALLNVIVKLMAHEVKIHQL